MHKATRVPLAGKCFLTEYDGSRQGLIALARLPLPGIDASILLVPVRLWGMTITKEPVRVSPCGVAQCRTHSGEQYKLATTYGTCRQLQALNSASVVDQRPRVLGGDRCHQHDAGIVGRSWHKSNHSCTHVNYCRPPLTLRPHTTSGILNSLRCCFPEAPCKFALRF